jgi:hypothetical protein
MYLNKHTASNSLVYRLSIRATVCLLTGLLTALSALSQTVIVSDSYSAANGTALAGKAPDVVNLTFNYYGRNGGNTSYVTSIQNGLAVLGADIGIGIALNLTNSAQITLSYLFNVSVDTGNQTLNAQRGAGLGFFSSAGTNNAHGYYNFTGLVVDTNGSVRLLTGGNSTAATTVAGFNISINHTLSYTVNTTNGIGTMSNILLDGSTVSLTAPANTFTIASTAYAGFYNSSGAAGDTATFGNFNIRSTVVPGQPSVPVDLPSGALDTVLFGYTNSESAHGLINGFPPPTATNSIYTYPLASNPSVGQASDVVYGGLGQLERRLLPRTPTNDMYGGELDFTMAVDPGAQNYFTMRFWGSDTMSQMLILNCNGYEVGGRHGYDYEEGSLTEDGGGWLPNRFYYRTVKLPLRLTLGQTSVAFKLRSAGFINEYGNGYTPGYQFLMNGPTIGLSRAYTHTKAFLDVIGETQGAVQPAPPIRPSPTSSQVATWSAAVNSKVTSLLALNPNSFTADNVDFLAQTYAVPWSTGYSNSAVPAQVIAAIDAMVTIAATNSGGLNGYMGSFGNSSWGGYFGPVGDAVRLLWPQLSNSLSATVSYGGVIGTTTRQSAWSQALRASVDFGRYNRKSISNQELLNDFNIYKANAGLLLVQPTNAIYATNVLRYLYEAAGLSPYMGNDQTGGGPVPIPGIAPYGPNWYFTTSKGTSKENGMATDYGEVGSMIYDMAKLSGDTNLLAQALKVFRARCVLRFPAVDTSGYAEMMAPAPIGCRRNALPGFEGYLTQWETIHAAADGAAPDLVGYFQQQMVDNQFFQVLATISGNAQAANGPYLPGYYSNAVAQAATGIKLPMSAGQPDFAWGDEENMVVAAKHGEERFFATLAWRLDTGNLWQAINGMASVFLVGTNMARFAEVMVNDVQFNSAGTFVTRNGSVDVAYEPPDNATYPNAETGNGYPFALRPDLTSIPSINQDSGRGTAYTLRYGNWLVGINANPTNGDNYTMLLPSDFTSATNLVTGQLMSGPVTLSPKTTAVFYLTNTSDPNPSAPPTPLLLTAVGTNNSIALSWPPSGGATSYSLMRANISGGPYIMIAGGITNLSFSDTNVAAAVTYFYRVQALNAAGASKPSAEAFASAGLPSPWLQADVDALGVAGYANYNAGTFTVLGSGSGMPYSPPSQCHIVYQQMIGNGAISARLVSPAATVNLSKSGVIMRQSLTGGSQEAFMNLQPSPLQATFQIRASSNGSASAAGTNISSQTWWLKLTRTNNVFTGYASPDGVNWTQVGTANSITMTDPIYVGMFVSSLDNTRLGQATFDNVTTTNWSTPATPATPTNLVAAATGAQISLVWNQVANASSYNIKRTTTNGGPYTIIADSITITNYTDSGLPGGTRYYYVVSAMGLGGEGANSSQATAQTISLAPVQMNSSVTSGKIQLSWLNDHTGWSLQVQTNSLTNGLGNNWVIWPNSSLTNQIEIPVVTTNGSVFFRLVYP